MDGIKATSAAANSSIGVVETAKGDVYVLHADGSHEILQKGVAVFQGDQVETGAHSAVAITFVDQSSFSLGEHGSLVLDEMVFDPSSGSGSASLSVAEGVFAFVSGQIAKTDPDAMMVKLPVMTIGVRGTKVAGVAHDEGGETVVSLLAEANGHVGEITITNDAGVQVLNQAHQTIQVASSFEAPPPPIVLPLSQVEHMFGSALDVVPAEHASGGAEGADHGADTALGAAHAAAAGDALASADDPGTGTQAHHDGLDHAGIDAIPHVADGFADNGGDPTDFATVVDVIDASDKTTAATFAEFDLPSDIANEIAAVASSTLLANVSVDTSVGTDTSANTADDTTYDHSTSTVSTVQTNVVYGNEKDNTLIGTAHDDTIYGLGGDDHIGGGKGDDHLFGGAGNDRIDGGLGADVMNGGSGADTFEFSAPTDGTHVSTNVSVGAGVAVDKIVDFTHGVDSISINAQQFGFGVGTASDGVNFLVVNGTYDGTNASGGNYDSKDPTLILDNSGTLYYDDNGSDQGYTVIAQVQDGGTVTADDVHFTV